MDDQDIFDYNYELGLDREEVGEGETDSITGVARESGLSSIPVVSDFALEEYKAARDAYNAAYSGEGGVLSQIQKARDILLSQPTQKTRGEFVQGLAQSLTAPRKETDPRFYERRNLFTFLRDVGEYGAAEKKAEQEAKLKQQLDLLKLDELKAKYGQEQAEKRFSLASDLLQKQRAPAAAKEDEIIRLQKYRDTLDITDPRRREITERINYLARGKAGAAGPEPSVGQKQVDKKVADEYASWVVGGGGAQAASRIAKIDDVVSQLSAEKSISGPVVGYALENLPTVASVLYPQAQDVKDVVESVVQTDLRAILGGQFAQKEGEALIKRAYNPRLQEWQNAIRLRLLSKQMSNVADEKNRVMDYFSKNNGSMSGYDFKPYTASDFLTADQLKRIDSLTPEQRKRIEAGEDVEKILFEAPKPKQKPAAGKPTQEQPKKKKVVKRTKKLPSGRVVEIEEEVEE